MAKHDDEHPVARPTHALWSELLVETDREIMQETKEGERKVGKEWEEDCRDNNNVEKIKKQRNSRKGSSCVEQNGLSIQTFRYKICTKE